MRTPGKKTILLTLAALIALLLAGCGGGGGEETETTAPTIEEPTALTKDELIEQGDGVCAEVNAAVGALSASETEGEGETSNTEKVANLYIGMVERLEDLGSPEGAEAEYEKFQEATEELGQVEADLKLASEREDVATVEEKGQEAAAALEEFQTQAAAYGFEKCGEEPGLPTPAGGGETPGGEEFEGGEEEGGVEVEPEFEEPAPEEEVVPEEEVAPETGGAGGSPEAPAPEPETGSESGGVGPG